METLRTLGASERPVAEVLPGLTTVCTLLRNISTAPEEVKYRRLRLDSAEMAPLLGKVEEGVLCAAGFAMLEPEFFDFRSDQLETLREVLQAAEVVMSTLQRALDDLDGRSAASAPNGKSSGALLCRDDRVAQSLECALLDHVGQLSRDAADAEKRRRKADEIEAVRSPGWRDAIKDAGGSFFVDGGAVEEWLEGDVKGRTLAHSLLQLQAAARQWYGELAAQYCDRWQSSFSSTAASGESSGEAAKGGEQTGGEPKAGGRFCKLLEGELQAFQEALFAFPERPGAVPVLFRPADAASKEQRSEESAKAPGGGAAGGDECAFVQERDADRWGLAEVVALEE
eukprot:TRINITY_DN12550_c0_g1_i1.p1 TRINITY_DN12550_c0_g1~~TRINITY_DN12550_c0_g1_i1.p1  ORF type:complete len:341 (-),score=110.00 TRINITY_DN12550_c0_g1_i1:368-1390(-)